MGRRSNLENLFYNTDIKARENGQLCAGVELLPINKIINQSHRSINEKVINNLAEDILSKGIEYPIIVYKKEDNYVIVDGEKRYRAIKQLRINEIECIVKNLNENQVSEINFIERLKDNNINIIDQAKGMQYLINNYGYTQEKLAESIGKSRSVIANILRLLNLSPQVLELINEGKITQGHAKAISSIKNQVAQINLANNIVNHQLSVRLTEGIVARYKNPKSKDELKYNLTQDLKNLVKKIENTLDVKTTLKGSIKKGEITLYYFDNQTLKNIDDAMDLIKKNQEN